METVIGLGRGNLSARFGGLVRDHLADLRPVGGLIVIAMVDLRSSGCGSRSGSR